MGDMLIRNISASERADLERLAQANDASLAETAREAFREGLRVLAGRKAEQDDMPMGQRLRQIFAGVFDTQEEFEDFQRILGEVRSGPHRPLPFAE